jgi:hypothetical protein
MPRGGSSKKAAAQQWGKIKAMEAATKDGKYLIARVEKSIGFCQFLAKLQMPDGSIRDTTVLVRGKNKGGRHCATRVDVGCFVMVEGDASKKIMEVISVANKQSDLERLRRAGRVSDKLAGEEHELDDLFELAEDEEDDDMKKTEKERAEKEKSRAEELVARYRLRAEAGVKTRAEFDIDRGLVGVEDAPEEVDGEEEFAAGGAPRRRRRVKLASAPATATVIDLYSAQDQQQKPEDGVDLIAEATLDRRVVPDRWDDEEAIDIDAI